MSMDASKGQQFDRAGLYVKLKGDTCLTFWYNMRGNGAGSIEVTVNNKNNPVLELKGPKDAIWHKAQVEVTGAKRKVRLILRRPHYARELRRKKKIEKAIIFGFVFEDKALVKRRMIVDVIIQQIVTLSKYGHDALDICHP